tara:strand:+ start:958 stop:2562 length:1605 start_codon:yes stop_codon:yes gene_type:complete
MNGKILMTVVGLLLLSSMAAVEAGPLKGVPGSEHELPLAEDKIKPTLFSPALGAGLAIMLLVIYLIIGLIINQYMAKDTHTFLIAERNVGLGMGIASVSATWMWAMGIAASGAVAYLFGFAGLWWFCLPQIPAFALIVPFTRYIRNVMPGGYTLAEYARVRLGNLGRFLFALFLILGAIGFASINIKGVSLGLMTMFGFDFRPSVYLIAFGVLAYAIFGGMWRVAVISTIQYWMICIFGFIALATAIHQVGGTTWIAERMMQTPIRYQTLMDPKTIVEYGILGNYGLISGVICEQAFWQRVWSMKRKAVENSFIQCIIWVTLEIILFGYFGIIGIAMGANLMTDLGGDGAAVASWVTSHIGVGYAALAYMMVLFAAGMSSLDAAYMAVGSILAVDFVKYYKPGISDNGLRNVVRIGMVIGAIGAVGVVESGLSMVGIIIMTLTARGGLLFPLLLTFIWDKTSEVGACLGIILSSVIGIPIYFYYSNWWGLIAIQGIALGVTVIISLIKPGRPHKLELLLEADIVKRSRLGEDLK